MPSTQAYSLPVLPANGWRFRGVDGDTIRPITGRTMQTSISPLSAMMRSANDDLRDIAITRHFQQRLCHVIAGGMHQFAAEFAHQSEGARQVFLLLGIKRLHRLHPYRNPRATKAPGGAACPADQAFRKWRG